jgi:hypothetical protein
MLKEPLKMEWFLGWQTFKNKLQTRIDENSSRYKEEMKMN